MPDEKLPDGTRSEYVLQSVPLGQLPVFAAVVMLRVEPAKTGMVIAVIDLTDADCRADRVTSTGSVVPAVRDEVIWLESVTGLPGLVELPVTDMSGI